MSTCLRFLLVFLSACLFQAVHAQDTNLYDTSRLRVTGFDETQINKYRNSSDFDYSVEVVKARGILDRLKDWLGEFFRKIFGDATLNYISEYYLYVLVAIAIVTIVWFIIKSEASGLLGRRSSKNLVRGAFLDTEINLEEADQLIEQAVAGKRYEEAIRLCLVKVLNLLADSGQIKWKTDKTNREYLVEIKDGHLQEPLGTLSLYFEYSRYGQFMLDEPKFLVAFAAYQEVLKQVEVSA